MFASKVSRCSCPLCEHHMTGAATSEDGSPRDASKLMREATFVACGLALHNFPEGLATFAGGLESREVGALPLLEGKKVRDVRIGIELLAVELDDGGIGVAYVLNGELLMPSGEYLSS